jgi:hypothetical protein
MPRDPDVGGYTSPVVDEQTKNAGARAAAAAAAATGSVNTTTLAGIAKASGTAGAIGTPVNANLDTSMFKAVDPTAPKMFTGPIPVDATRTATGYVQPDGTVVDPFTPYTLNPDGTITSTSTSATSATTTTTAATGMTAAEIAALLATQAAQFQQQMAAMQAQITQQIADAQKAATAAAEQQKKDAVAAQRKSAFEITKERFAQAGLKELGDEITAIYQGTGKDRFGKAFDEIPTTGEGFYLALINTKSYYDRFGKVNEDRLANGFKALDERTIVGMEDEYQTVLQAYKAPAGFYDSAQDYQMFLKNNYSKNDVASALQAAADVVASKDPNIRKQLADYFGVDDGALTAYYADPVKGQKVLENITGKNMNTAAALLAGLSKEDATVGQQYGAGSFTYEQNRQRYSQAAKSIEQTGALASIYGENFGAKEAIAAEFGDVQAQQQATRIRNTALAGFGGSSGVGTKALRTTGQVQ